MNNKGYSKFIEYKEKKKDFLMGLMNTYLMMWFLDEKNEGKDPFISIKIFQYDESKMKEGLNKIKETQIVKTPKVKIIKQKKTQLKQVYIKKEKTKHWLGDQEHVKVTNQTETKIKLKDAVLDSTELQTEMIPYDPEVHCFIENYNSIPIQGVYTVACQTTHIIENNQILYPSVVPIHESIMGRAIIDPNAMVVLNRSYDFDVERAVDLLSNSKTINCEYKQSTVNISINVNVVESIERSQTTIAQVITTLQDLKICDDDEQRCTLLIAMDRCKSRLLETQDPIQHVDIEESYDDYRNNDDDSDNSNYLSDFD
jgi:hypothetical protein